MMPDRLRPVGGERRADQLVRYLAEHSDIPVVDTRPVVQAARASGEILYYPFGSHWSDLGAFPAYEALSERLATLVPGFEPLPRSAFQVRQNSDAPDNWLRKMHLGDAREQGDPVLIRKGFARKPKELPVPGDRLTFYESGPAEAGQALALGDSFFDALGPFVAEHFARLTVCRIRLEPDPARIPRWIEEERPVVVIEELVERVLMDPPFPPDPWPDAWPEAADPLR